MFISAAENGSQQLHFDLLLDYHLLKTIVTNSFRKRLRLFCKHETIERIERRTNTILVWVS